MGNFVLANAAKAAMKDDDITSERGMCSRFTRQVSARVYGRRFASMFGASARESAENFKAAGYGHTVKSVGGRAGLQPGDLLYKTKAAGKFGHVGIYVGDGVVAENSSTKLGRISGAKGFRTLAQFDLSAVDVVVRLPAPENIQQNSEKIA